MGATGMMTVLVKAASADKDGSLSTNCIQSKDLQAMAREDT